jgi:hypothetical protein
MKVKTTFALPFWKFRLRSFQKAIKKLIVLVGVKRETTFALRFFETYQRQQCHC